MKDLLPAHWAIKSLGDLVDKIDYGHTASATTAPVGPKFLRITDIYHGCICWDEVPYCDAQNGDIAKYGLQSGDIVIARTGSAGNSQLIGQCPKDAIFASYLIRVRPSSALDSRFLSYFFQTPFYWNQLKRYAAGAIQLGVNATKLKSLEIPLPPLPEQTRIADILDKAYAIRRKRLDALQRIDAMIQAGFMEFVGPVAAGYRDWPLKTVEQYALPSKGSLRTGPFGSDLRHSEFIGQGICVLGIDNAVQNRFAWDERRFISEEKYESLKRYTVFPNDVIITIMGTTGRSAVVPEDIPTAITTKHLACITLDRDIAEPEFLSNAIHRHPAVLSQIGVSHRGAIMPGLNLTLIKSITIHTPPIYIQREFTLFVQRVRQLEDQLSMAVNRSNGLFNSLVQRAFRGDL